MNEIIAGIDSASITNGETQEMAAEYIRVAPGRRWTATAPRGSDCYLFMLDGTSAISAADHQYHFPAQAFAVVQEGIEFAVESKGGAPARIINVIAPPQPSGRSTAGFTGKIAVVERAEAPMLDLPDEKKRRIYFVDDDAVKSQRGHAMIVLYEKGYGDWPASAPKCGKHLRDARRCAAVHRQWRVSRAQTWSSRIFRPERPARTACC